MTITVQDVPEAHRYEARVAGTGELAGISEYIRAPGQITFVHTEIDPAYEGHGVGSQLVRVSLDEARTEGLRVVPSCPFYAGWIRRHPEYVDLVERSVT